jgi:hypothetical protein
MAITNSNEKQLPTSEVIAQALADAQREKLLGDVPLYAAIMATIREGTLPNTTVEQIGNTVFISHYSEDKAEVAMRAMNVDTARNYLDNSIEYIKKMDASGVQRLTSDFKDKRILQLFKSISRRPEFSHWGMKVYRAKDGNMRAYVVMPKDNNV